MLEEERGRDSWVLRESRSCESHFRSLPFFLSRHLGGSCVALVEREDERPKDRATCPTSLEVGFRTSLADLPGALFRSVQDRSTALDVLLGHQASLDDRYPSRNRQSSRGGQALFRNRRFLARLCSSRLYLRAPAQAQTFPYLRSSPTLHFSYRRISPAASRTAFTSKTSRTLLEPFSPPSKPSPGLPPSSPSSVFDPPSSLPSVRPRRFTETSVLDRWKVYR